MTKSGVGRILVITTLVMWKCRTKRMTKISQWHLPRRQKDCRIRQSSRLLSSLERHQWRRPLPVIAAVALPRPCPRSRPLLCKSHHWVYRRPRQHWQRRNRSRIKRTIYSLPWVWLPNPLSVRIPVSAQLQRLHRKNHLPWPRQI